MQRLTALYMVVAGLAGAGNFPFGVDYAIGVDDSNGVPNYTGAIAVDAAGSVYLMQNVDPGVLKPTIVLGSPATSQSAYVTKLSPDGSRTVYVTQLGFTAAQWLSMPRVTCMFSAIP